MIQCILLVFTVWFIMIGLMFQVALVVGGGNIFRGASWAGSSGLDRSSADYIG